MCLLAKDKDKPMIQKQAFEKYGESNPLKHY